MQKSPAPREGGRGTRHSVASAREGTAREGGGGAGKKGPRRWGGGRACGAARPEHDGVRELAALRRGGQPRLGLAPRGEAALLAVQSRELKEVKCERRCVFVIARTHFRFQQLAAEYESSRRERTELQQDEAATGGPRDMVQIGVAALTFLLTPQTALRTIAVTLPSCGLTGAYDPGAGLAALAPPKWNRHPGAARASAEGPCGGGGGAGAVAGPGWAGSGSSGKRGRILTKRACATCAASVCGEVAEADPREWRSWRED